MTILDLPCPPVYALEKPAPEVYLGRLSSSTYKTNLINLRNSFYCYIYTLPTALLQPVAVMNSAKLFPDELKANAYSYMQNNRANHTLQIFRLSNIAINPCLKSNNFIGTKILFSLFKFIARVIGRYKHLFSDVAFS